MFLKRSFELQYKLTLIKLQVAVGERKLLFLSLNSGRSVSRHWPTCACDSRQHKAADCFAVEPANSCICLSQCPNSLRLHNKRELKVSQLGSWLSTVHLAPVIPHNAVLVISTCFLIFFGVPASLKNALEVWKLERSQFPLCSSVARPHGPETDLMPAAFFCREVFRPRLDTIINS